MSRPLRLEFKGAFYHVMSRGNERRSVFQDDEDRRFFLELLKESAERWDIRIHAYALMGNHFHLFLEAKAGLLSLPMRHINGVYTQNFNRKYHRVGHLFQGRFKALLVDKDAYLLILSRYIHQNPVKAKLVARAEEYPWSSYRSFLGLVPVPPWLEIQETLNEFADHPDRQRRAYREFVEVEQKFDPLKQALGQLVLGSEHFLKTVRDRLSKTLVLSHEHSQQKAFRPKVSFDKIIEHICLAFGITKEGLLGGRSARTPARPAAMFLLRNRSLLKQRQIAELFKVSYPAVSLTIKRFERKMNQEPKLKEMVEELNGRVG